MWTVWWENLGCLSAMMQHTNQYMRLKDNETKQDDHLSCWQDKCFLDWWVPDQNSESGHPSRAAFPLCWVEPCGWFKHLDPDNLDCWHWGPFVVEPTGGMIWSIWPLNPLGSHRRSWKVYLQPPLLSQRLLKAMFVARGRRCLLYLDLTN